MARQSVRTTQTPSGEVELDIPALGRIKGLIYPNGVRQFLGIPYARLSKRWTRSTLATSWLNNYHDGRDLGSQAPNPPQFRSTGPLTPIDTFAHLTEPMEDESTCLILNITLPPVDSAQRPPYPIMFYIHGGSFIFGGGNRSIFDGVNFVSHSVAISKPVVAINMNYRVGLGGFLASNDILADMQKDGLSGVGNWGLTDQQTALEWVQRYASSLGGDTNNVTVYGLSAGGISIGHHLRSRHPPVFHRAISMSGVEHSIPTMTLEDHEAIYQRLLKHFNIDGSKPDALERLRAVSELEIADATFEVYASPNIVSSPCDDGVFHIGPTQPMVHHSPPKWLKSYMVGDVRHEGEIFVQPMDESKDFQWFKDQYCQHMSCEDAQFILDLYGLTPQSDYQQRMQFVKTVFGDCAFGIPQRKALQVSTLPESYGYHFDVVSKIKTSCLGVAFHALDLQYIFLNMHDELEADDRAFGKLVAQKYIEFAYGKAPWEAYHSAESKWGIFSPNYKVEALTEQEDNAVRQYSRWDKIEHQGLMMPFLSAYHLIRNAYA